MFSFCRTSSFLHKWKVKINYKSHIRHLSYKSLHPFYLTVHPDLFNGYPVEQKTNEESLKVLHSYLNGLEHRQPVYSTTLLFYKKDQDQLGKDAISQVKILLSSKSTSAAIQEIMKAFDLPHDTVVEDTSKYRGWGDSLEIFGNDKESYAPFMGNLNVGIFKSAWKLTLESWLDKNHKTVSSNRKNAKQFERAISEVMTVLKSKYGVADLSNDNQYTLSLVHGGLKQLEMMLNSYFFESCLLKGRIIKFGDFNGLDQVGRMLFNVNDVPSDWKLGLSLVSDSAKLLVDIKELEMSLKGNCHGLKFIRPRGSHSIPVQLYFKGLDIIYSNIKEFIGKEDESKSYKGVLAICDWDDDFVGISHEGYVKVPLQASKNSLISFIDRNLVKIRNTRKDYLRNLQIQQTAMLSCKLKVGLNSLNKDSAINTTQTVDACNKLETCDGVEVMKNWNVVLSKYYSVSANGLVRIPWNFELD